MKEPVRAKPSTARQSFQIAGTQRGIGGHHNHHRTLLIPERWDQFLLRLEYILEYFTVHMPSQPLTDAGLAHLKELTNLG
jgi:hypothetical protein